MFRLYLCICIFLAVAQAKFKSLHCQVYDKDQVTMKLCEIKAISRTRNSVNIKFDLLRTVDEGVMAQIQMFKRANGWRPFLYDFKIDGCKFLRKPYNLIGNLAFEYLKPFTNVNRTCPYRAGTTIIVKNFELDVDKFRSRFPIDNGEYALQVTFTINNLVKLSINGSIYHFDYKDQ